MNLALVGGAYGSEGKGVVAAGLAHMFGAAVRTGGPNAGHSFYHERVLYKMRSVPCAWVNPGTRLFLGAGAVIDPALLEYEVAMTERMIVVDPQAIIITNEMHQSEVSAGMRETIGSTTEGVGAARIAKIRRDGSAAMAKDYDFTDERIVIERVAPTLHGASGAIMLEGTQGALLSLHHGRYPYTTSNDTNAAQLAADAGIPPSRVEHTHLVVRTHPIRVAGNSGPTGGHEMDWADLPPGAAAVPERTTVTNNVRRLFQFSAEDLQTAIMLNDPCGVWVTFGDYLSPKARDARDIDDLMDIPEVREWIWANISPTSIRLMGIGIGGEFWKVIETGDACYRPGGHRPEIWPLEVHND